MTVTWNSADKDAAVTLSNSDKTASKNSSVATWRGVRGTDGFVDTGKRYFEVTCDAVDTIPGWIVGLSNRSAALNAFLGSSGFMIGFQAERSLWTNNVQTVNAWKGCVAGDVLGIAVDFANKKIWITNTTSDAGVWNNGTGGTQNPSTGSGGITIGSGIIDGSSTVYPHFTGYYNASVADTITMNTGDTSFAGTLPTGFTAWDALTNSSATVWDNAHKSGNIALGRNDTAAWSSASNASWKGVRGTRSKSTGKWYIEFTTGYRANNGHIVGFGNITFNTASYPGSDGNSFGYQTEGSTYGLTAASWQGAGFVGEVIKIAIDLDAKLVWARVDANANWNNSGTADPATGVGGKSYTTTGALFPVWSGFGALANGQNNACVINSGYATLLSTPPSGFSAWDTGAPSNSGISGTRPTVWDSGNKNANVVLSGSNLVATQSGASNNWCGVRSTTSHDSGQKYFEVTVTATSSGGFEIGLQDADESLANGTGPGSSWRSISFRNGTNDIYFMNVSNGGTVVWSGAAATQVIGIAVDFDKGLAWAKNVTTGSNWNNDANADPVLGKRGSYCGSIKPMFIGWAGNRAGGTNDVVTLNAGATAFVGTPPSGYVAWDTASPQTLTPSLYTDADTFYAPTVSNRKNLQPSLYTDADTFYTPTLVRGPAPNSNRFVSVVTG